jgi:hypothetical protein
MAMAFSILDQYKGVKVEFIPLSMMKPGQVAPSVMVDGDVLAADGGKGNGVAVKQEVIDALVKKGAVKYEKD